MKITSEQFAQHFNDRLRMLSRSGEAYDEGDYAEATRLAGTVVKLIGDRIKKTGEVNKNFISLASRLGIKPKEMINSSLAEAMAHQNLHGPLCVMGFHLAGANGMVPILDGFAREPASSVRKTQFDEWWNEIVLRDCRGNEFSRRVIVETMRDQEDAHTDGELDPEYAEVAYNGAIGIRQINHTNVELDINPARVIVRQIAHEILRTFVTDLPSRFVRTHGLLVQPIALYEIMEKRESGELIQVLDHKAIEFQAENTATPEIWKEWERFIKVGSDSMPIASTSSQSSTRDWKCRMVLLNYAPCSIEGYRAMVAMQHP